MKISAVVNSMLCQNEAFKFVSCKFATSATQYTYKTLLDLKVGDMVLVATNSGMQAVTVTAMLEVDEVDLNAYDYKWVAQKIDISHLEACEAKEAELVKLIRSKQRQHTSDQAMKALLGDDSESKEEVKRLVRL